MKAKATIKSSKSTIPLCRETSSGFDTIKEHIYEEKDKIASLSKPVAASKTRKRGPDLTSMKEVAKAIGPALDYQVQNPGNSNRISVMLTEKPTKQESKFLE